MKIQNNNIYINNFENIRIAKFEINVINVLKILKIIVIKID